MDCIFIEHEKGVTCKRCGRPLRLSLEKDGPIYRECLLDGDGNLPSNNAIQSARPGYHLHAILKNKFGINLPHDCATRKLIARLSQRSITEWKEQVHEISYELYVYGKARGWLDKIATGDDVVEALENVILMAIDEAEKEAAEAQATVLTNHAETI